MSHQSIIPVVTLVTEFTLKRDNLFLVCPHVPFQILSKCVSFVTHFACMIIILKMFFSLITIVFFVHSFTCCIQIPVFLFHMSHACLLVTKPFVTHFACSLVFWFFIFDVLSLCQCVFVRPERVTPLFSLSYLWAPLLHFYQEEETLISKS